MTKENYFNNASHGETCGTFFVRVMTKTNRNIIRLLAKQGAEGGTLAYSDIKIKIREALSCYRFQFKANK